jgi:hypothetical protein
MNIVQIVQRIERAGISLKLQDEKLQVLAETPLNDKQRAFVKANRDDLIGYLKVMDDPNIKAMQALFDASVQAIHANETTLV